MSWSVDSADSYLRSNVCLFFYLGRVIPNTKYYNFLSELRFRPNFLTCQLTGTFVFSLTAFSSLHHHWKNRHLNSSQRSMTSHSAKPGSAPDPICAHLFRVITLRLCECILIQGIQRPSCEPSAQPLPTISPPLAFL